MGAGPRAVHFRLYFPFPVIFEIDVCVCEVCTDVAV